MKSKVSKKKITYDEVVNDFTGLIFHCPKCNCEMHLHIAEIDFKPIRIQK
jgi:hypothetical protein